MLNGTQAYQVLTQAAQFDRQVHITTEVKTGVLVRVSMLLDTNTGLYAMMGDRVDRVTTNLWY